MKSGQSDLIAIANADLAEKLAGKKKNTAASKTKKNSKNDVEKVSFIENNVSAAQASDQDDSFQKDIWRAVYTLNVFRYGLGLTLLILFTASSIDSNWQVFRNVAQPKLFFFAALALLASAIVFSYLSKRKGLDFNRLVGLQFALDIILAAMLTHTTGSVNSNFSILYMIVVATGSVVLPRRLALALASGAIIALFLEHLYSVFVSLTVTEPSYSWLGTYGVMLMIVSILVAYLAERIRSNELQSYVPGSENIEDYLVREEITALKNALKATNGNKTEAAKLLGMTFRSFRYKLTKYDIN